MELILLKTNILNLMSLIKNFEIIKIKLEEYYNIAVDFNAGLKK